MTELLPALGQVLITLLMPVGLVLVLARFVPRLTVGRRRQFLVAMLAAPVVTLVLAGSGAASPPVLLVLALLGIFAGTLGFPLITLRRPATDASADAHRAQVHADVVLYLVTSVLWFTALYWVGSGPGIEGLHYEVAPAIIGGAQPGCAQQPQFVCNHLTFVEALALSAGTLLTVGAPGITPLDEITRFFGLLQYVPVFIAAYVWTR